MSILYNPLNFLLDSFFSITGDWGISIILLTVLVKTLLLPLSIKQKTSIRQQQEMTKTIEELKEKFKNDKEKLESELKKHYQENAKNMLGCFVSLVQLPIISSLYFLVMRMPVEIGTIMIPWVANMKRSDNLFLVPILYVLIALSPNLLSRVPYLKTTYDTKVTMTNLIITSVLSMILTIKAPIAIGLYFITTGLFTLLEEIGYRVYMKKKCIN